MRNTNENTDTKNPEWVYFKGDIDLYFDNTSDIHYDLIDESVRSALSDTCPSHWKECLDLHVSDPFDPGFSLVFPLTVYCRVETSKAAQLSDREVHSMLQQALDKMVERLVNYGPDDLGALLNSARKVVLTGVTRERRADGEYGSYLEEVADTDVASAQGQSAAEPSGRSKSLPPNKEQ